VGRFSSGLVVGMKKPDGPTRLGIARAQARRLTGGVDDGILQFLAEHVRGNAREIAGAVKQVHHHAQMNGGTISLQGARALLEDYVREHRRCVDVARIREVVAGHFGIAPEKLESKARDRRTAFARQIAMYLSRQYTGKSLAEVGKCFGNRNHATVKCAEAKVARLLQPEGSQFAKDIEVIKEALEE
jgi:chromosomal replication initiator protein